MNKLLGKLKISTRLRLGFAIMIGMLALMTGLGLLRMAENQQRIEHITGVNAVKSKRVALMRDTVQERMVALRNIALVGSLSEMQPEMGKINLQHQRYGEAQSRLLMMFAAGNAGAQQRQEKALLAQVQQAEQAALPLIKKAAELGMASQIDQLYDVLIKELVPLQGRWMGALDALIRFEDHASEQASAEARAAFENARILMLAIGGASVLAALWVSIVLSRSMLGQLGGELAYANAIAHDIAAGDLSVAIATRPGDDLSLLFVMKTMRDNLASIVGKVHGNSSAIAGTTGEIEANNAELSQHTAVQGACLDRTALLMQEMTATVRENVAHAGQATLMVGHAAASAGKGGRVVTQVVATMDAINDSACRIADITGVIDGIAFQTNLLALNAAVEAARAGEHGRGFAVVAAEVRALAQRSAGAAKEIKALIGDSQQKVGAGAQLVYQTGQSMREIVDSVGKVADVMARISAATDLQGKSIVEVEAAILEMDSITRKNASLVDQASAQAARLKEQAGGLADAVSKFKTQDQGIGQVDTCNPNSAFLRTAALPYSSEHGKRRRISRSPCQLQHGEKA
jgi:methyl-accepting chemotaxis protein